MNALTRPRQPLLSRIALAVASGLALQFAGTGPAAAHGAAATMVPMKKTLEDFGATLRWDAYAEVWTITRNSTVVRARPGARTVLVNGQPLKLEVPIVQRAGTAFIAKDFINQVFQSGLDKTFVVERVPSPLNPLTADEIKATVAVLKSAGRWRDGLRFTEISVKTPPKAQVWAFALEGKPVSAPREAAFVILDGKKVIEGAVDLQRRTVTQWQDVPGAHGMVLVDDFATVQSAIERSADYAAALARRGITDVKKVVGTPLTVGYFDGKDTLRQEDRLLKVVSYLDVGDGNYWAHPIENLVAVVDLQTRQVVKVEDNGVIPVPMTARPYDGRDRAALPDPKPLDISEPEGKNYTISGNTLRWQNWQFHMRLDSRVGLVLSTVTYNDKGTRRKVMYEGSLGGMIVPYGDPDVGWYFKAYLDSGEYGMGTLTSPIEPGKDAPANAVLLDSMLADYAGAPMQVPRAIAVFERYAGPEFKHQERECPNFCV